METFRKFALTALAAIALVLFSACATGHGRNATTGEGDGGLPPGPAGGIAGYISDSDGSPIMGARIKVSHPGFGRHWTTQADSDGKYSVSGLPAVDGYTMTVSTPPFWITTLRDLAVKAGEVTTVNVTRRLPQHPGPLTPGTPGT